MTCSPVFLIFSPASALTRPCYPSVSTTAIEEFESEQPRYQNLLDPQNLQEYERDPSAFKGTLSRDCPIVRRCLQSRAKVMDSYRRDFQLTSGAEMLEVTQSIVQFAVAHVADFGDQEHKSIRQPMDLDVSES